MSTLFDDDLPWWESYSERSAAAKNPLLVAAPLFPFDDFDSAVGALGGLPVGIKSSYPVEYVRRVTAAVISYQLSLSSIDYAKKRYVIDEERPETNSDRLDIRITNAIEDGTNSIFKHVVELAHLGDENVGTFMAQVTFVRARASIAGMLTCANRGMLFEAIAIARMLIEQIAWAVSAVGNDDADAVKRIAATKAIKKLRTAHRSAGDFYGWLSDYAHWAYHAHLSVLSVEDGKPKAVLASCIFKCRALMVSLIVTDCMLSAFLSAFPEMKNRRKLKSKQKDLQTLAMKLVKLRSDDEVLIRLTSYFAAR